MSETKYYKAKIDVEILKIDGSAEARVYHVSDVETNVVDPLYVSNLENIAKLIMQRSFPDDKRINIRIESDDIENWLN